ncbi:LPXTG cell wall anchor domain-containing protein [Streptomyces sp. NPDC000880]
MTKKTRIRVARIAAGAVIAAGASLTAAGAASAVGGDLNLGPLTVKANVDQSGVEAGLGIDGDPTVIPDPTVTPPTTPPVTPDPPTTPPTTPEPPTTPPTTPEPPTTPPTTPEPPTGTPTDQPTGDPSENPTSPTTPGNGNDAGTCTVDLNGAQCADNTDTDSAGSQPVEQGAAKEELAQTGAAETTFLLIGAATMIAGGIGFRMLPRLVGGGRTVA